METTIEQNIDTVIFSLLEIKKKIKVVPNQSATTCHDCKKLKKNCRSTFKKYNKGLSLVENIVKLQKEVEETNSEYFKLNKKYIALKEKYEPAND
ncbi:17480_t:CDS:1, partial [Racocetra persica]